ncbi:complement component 1 Q subcomponent-binding protein, mitochondrial-like isoform X2 [Planococcus citri]|uniref:complement component 1 Q subcomponent-binding protein, mitochondrial-like isoform X2 n=1 Tax=Planococcus citri TaxID=170843 RepID=UPI0031F958DA
MNAAIGFGFKFPFKSMVEKSKPITTSKIAKQQLYSTYWNTHRVKSVMVKTNNFKSAADNSLTPAPSQFYSTTKNNLYQTVSHKIYDTRKIFESVPHKVDDFQIILNGPNVNLIKSLPDETVKVSFNVNHTVVRGRNEDRFNNYCTETPPQSKPDFEVDITKGDTTLRFACSFSKTNLFTSFFRIIGRERECLIREFAIYREKEKKQVYRCQVTQRDSEFYDGLIDLFEEKGINNRFLNRLKIISTTHERRCYIDSLKDLEEFSSTRSSYR